MNILTWSIFSKISSCMVDSLQYPFCTQQSFDTDWSACMNASCRYSDFRSQTESIAICKSWRCIVKDASWIDLSSKIFSWFCILGYNDIRMGASETMNVRDLYWVRDYFTKRQWHLGLTASSRSFTISMQHSRSPYSCLRVFACGGPNVKSCKIQSSCRCLDLR